MSDHSVHSLARQVHPELFRTELFQIASYVAAIGSVLLLSIVGLISFRLVSGYWSENDPEAFITARENSSTLKLAWSYFVTLAGAWVANVPAAFALRMGIIGLIVNAIGTGLSVFVIAYGGASIRNRGISVSSLHEYIKHRCGRLVQLYVAFLSLLVASVTLLAEYTIVASIFRDVVGLLDYPIVIVVAVTTAIYTVAGGLRMSILTDQIQASAIILLLVTITVFVAATFRVELPTRLPDTLAPNASGYLSLISLPLASFSVTFFSEAMWQRNWSARQRSSLTTGAVGAFLITTVVVFLMGFAGWLVAWAGLVETARPNTIIFQVLGTYKFSWPAVVLIVLITLMSESAIDSQQSAIAGVCTSYGLRNRGIWWTRAVLVLANIPLVVLGLVGYEVLRLFLIISVVSVMSFIPIASGLWDPSARYITGFSVVFGCITSIVCTNLYGMVYLELGFLGGLSYTFYSNDYDHMVFLVATATSVGGLALWASVAQLLTLVGVVRRPATRSTSSPTEMETGPEPTHSSPVAACDVKPGPRPPSTGAISQPQRIKPLSAHLGDPSLHPRISQCSLGRHSLKGKDVEKKTMPRLAKADLVAPSNALEAQTGGHDLRCKRTGSFENTSRAPPPSPTHDVFHQP